MNRLPLRFTFGILAFVVALPAGRELLSQSAVAPGVALKPCTWSTPENPALCGEHRVWENRAAKSGRKLALRIVVYPARNQPRQPDAVYFLDGGPSEAAADKAQGLPADELTRIRATRDLVFVNQRGTGAGSPLECDWTGGERGVAPFTRDLFPAEHFRKCAATWNADPRFYTTTLSADDIDEIRAALGYSQLNLWGISYGTRLAQEYARRYPQRTRTLTLDGVLDITQRMPLPFARGTQRSLERLFADCAADAVCAKSYPRLRDDFAAALAALSKQPATATHSDRGSAPEQIKISRDLFTTTLRSLLYSTERQRRIPRLIHEAAQGKFDDFARDAVRIRRGHLDGLGMYLALVCTEDVAFTSPAEAATAAAGTFIGTYWYDQLSAACKHVPRGTIPSDFHTPLKSNVPALLFSGYLDPTTPPEWGDAVARHLPNSLHIEMRYGSHSFHGKDQACADRVTQDFILSGSVKTLDTACLTQITRPPFLIP